jgi:pilus assembly protein CpaC
MNKQERKLTGRSESFEFGEGQKSDGEFVVKSQYKERNRSGASRPHAGARIRIGALLERAWFRAVLGGAVVLALMPVAVQAQERLAYAETVHTRTVTVTVGKTEDIHTDQSLADVTVGDPEIADVNPLTDHALSILGKKIGTTRVTVYNGDKKPVGIFDVEVSYDISRLAVEIARFTGNGIKVSSINGRLMLSGTAPDAVTLDKAVTIARQFGPEPINTVQVLQPQQVMLEVRFVEADRQASRDLGVQWNMFGNSVLGNTGSQLPASQLPITQPNGAFQQPSLLGAGIGGANVPASTLPISPVVAAGVLSGLAPFGFMVANLSNRLQVAVNALEQKGAARSLAEPNLVALSGDTASFLAGGEFPVPVPGNLGTVTIEYKKYGVGLAFTPTVLKDGVINLKIDPEVSTLDTSHPVTIAGLSVPPLIVRRASTTLELRDGQSFMLGGLLQNNGTNDVEQLPWVGDVPVLGALFRSTDYQKNETDLVILVTPHIVRPMAPNDPIHTPLDNTLPPNDVDLFLMGKTEVSPALARLAVGALNRPYVGHILDLPKNGGVYVSVKN